MVCHHIDREALCRIEPLTVKRLQSELGNRAHIALCITCDESFLRAPQTIRNGRELETRVLGIPCGSLEPGPETG